MRFDLLDTSKFQQKGFTLLETLVSLGIVALIMVLVAQVFFTTTRTNTKSELLKDVKQNGDFALEVIERMIRTAAKIESTCDAVGTVSDSLDIRNPDDNVSTLGCSFVNPVTRISSASGALTDYLTSNNVTLGGNSCSDTNNTLEFTCTRLPGQPPVVTVSFKLSQRGTPADQFDQASITFQTSVSPRN